MTKSEFRKAAEELSSKAQPVKKDTAGAQSRPPTPPGLGLLVPKPPFGMHVIPAAVRSVKPFKAGVLPVKEDQTEEF